MVVYDICNPIFPDLSQNEKDFQRYSVWKWSFSWKWSLGALSKAPWACHWFGSKGVYTVAEGATTCRHPHHLCLQDSATFHPEHLNSKLNELRRHGERGHCHGAEPKDDIVIREDCFERHMGAAVHFSKGERHPSGDAAGPAGRTREGPVLHRNILGEHAWCLQLEPEYFLVKSWILASRSVTKI